MFFLMLVTNAMLMALTGAYLALLFPYIYNDPTLGLRTARLTEKALFVIVPLLATPVLTWTAISSFGLQNGPYWMMLLQAVSYFVFGLPQVSSYAKLGGDIDPNSNAALDTEMDGRVVGVGSQDRKNDSLAEMVGGVRKSDLVCDELLSYFQTLHLFLPLGLHCSTYWRSILWIIPSTIGDWTHVTDVAILTLVPVLLIGLLGTVVRYSPLWWARSYGRFQDQFALCKLFVLVAVFVLIPCIEFRVVFSSFDHLLSGVSRPWNYIALTLALYSFVLSITIHLRSGAKTGHAFSSTLSSGPSSPPTSIPTFNALVATQLTQARRTSYFLATMCALMLSLALGVPFYLWPATLLSAIAFISFYFERRWWMYTAFVVGLLLGLTWFCFKTFFSLNYTFFTLAGFITIQVASIWIIVLAAIAASVTGLIIMGLAPKWANSLLIAQAVLIAILEEILHMEMLDNGFEIYPAYLVVLTTVLGVLTAQKLKREGLLNTNVLFLVSMIYLSKLALLLKPVSWPTISAMLLLTPPLYLVIKLWDAQNVLTNASKSNTISIIYVAWLFFATLFNRWTLFQRILEILAGEVHDHASPALVHGLSFVFFGALLPPLAWHHPYRSENAMGNEFSTRRRRLISFTGFAMIGLGFAAMSSQQMFGSSPKQHVLGSAIMSSVFGMRSGLPLISTLALICVGLIALLIVTGTININHSLRQRLIVAQALGLSLGAFISPFALSTNVTAIHASDDEPTPIFVVFGVCTMFQLAATLIAFADWHTVDKNAKWISWIPRLGPAVYVWMWLQWPFLFLGALLVSLLTEEWRRDELETYNVAILGVQAFAQGLVALALKILEPEEEKRAPNPAMRASWIPDVANVATVGCYGLSAAVLIFSGLGSSAGLVIIAPIMLLFQTSGRFRSVLPPNSPYFLVYIAAAAGLFLAAQLQLWLQGPLSALTQLIALSLPEHSVSVGVTSIWDGISEIAAHLAIMPPTGAIAFFMWDFAKPAFGFMAFMTWMASVPIFLSDADPLVMLAYLNTLICAGITLYTWVMATPARSRPLDTSIIRD